MQTTLTRFKDRYFNYKGAAGGDGNEIDKDDNGLAIGSFKSAFCADLCATYIFEMLERCFRHTKFKCIYRDDGLVIFLGKLTQINLAKWLKEFQHKVDSLVEGDIFNFTVEIWAPDEEVGEEKMMLDDQVKQKWLENVKII
eukprot:7421825-Ditylum_brightwellii.AAC.1